MALLDQEAFPSEDPSGAACQVADPSCLQERGHIDVTKAYISRAN